MTHAADNDAPPCEWCQGRDRDGQHDNGCRLGLGPDELANDFDALLTDLRWAILHWRGHREPFGNDLLSELEAIHAPYQTRVIPPGQDAS